MRDSQLRDDSTPLVSILIPVHNGLNFTRPCLESIFATATSDVPYELIIIDDQSSDGSLEYFQSLGSRIRVLQNEPRKTFAEKINLGASAASGEYLCLLNNDTVVTEGWLRKLLGVAREDPRIAVVGNRHLTPGTELINHAGMVFNPNRNPAHLYRGQPANFWPALLCQEFQMLTAACWVISKRTFLDLGGFDATFRNGCEDVDFCLRARQQGYKIFYNADSVIYHHGLSTPGRLDHEKANTEYLKTKWGAGIVPDMDQFYAVPKPVPKVLPKPEPIPESVCEVIPESLPAPLPEAGQIFLPENPVEPVRIPSHIEKRYAHIERLHARHPLIAGLLSGMVRLATSIAKTLDK